MTTYHRISQSSLHSESSLPDCKVFVNIGPSYDGFNINYKIIPLDQFEKYSKRFVKNYPENISIRSTILNKMNHNYLGTIFILTGIESYLEIFDTITIPNKISPTYRGGDRFYDLSNQTIISDESSNDYDIETWKGKDNTNKFCYKFSNIHGRLFENIQLKQLNPIEHKNCIVNKKRSGSKKIVKFNTLSSCIKKEYYREKLDLIMNDRKYMFLLFLKYIDENNFLNQDMCRYIFDHYMKSTINIHVKIPCLDIGCYQPKFFFINTGIVNEREMIFYTLKTNTKTTVTQRIRNYIVYFGKCPFYHKIPLPDNDSIKDCYKTILTIFSNKNQAYGIARIIDHRDFKELKIKYSGERRVSIPNIKSTIFPECLNFIVKDISDFIQINNLNFPNYLISNF